MAVTDIELALAWMARAQKAEHEVETLWAEVERLRGVLREIERYDGAERFAGLDNRPPEFDRGFRAACDWYHDRAQRALAQTQPEEVTNG